MAIYPLLGLISGRRVLWWWLIGVVGRDGRFQVAINVISSGVYIRIRPVTCGYGYGFLGGTKVCTRTCTLELPVALPTGISIPVTIPIIASVI